MAAAKIICFVIYILVASFMFGDRNHTITKQKTGGILLRGAAAKSRKSDG